MPAKPVPPQPLHLLLAQGLGRAHAAGAGAIGVAENQAEGDVPVGESSGGAGRPAIPDVLPVLPVRGSVIFPGTITPLTIGRPASRRLLDESLPKSKIIGLFAQVDDEEEEPDPEGLYTVGTAGMVLKLIRQPDETVSIIIHGLGRIRLGEVLQTSPFLKARVKSVKEKPGRGKGFAAAVKQVRDQAMELVELSPNTPEQAQSVLMNIEAPGNLADFLAANLDLETAPRQTLLEEADVAKRVRLVHQHVAAQLELARLQQKIQHDVQSSIGASQRKHFLREQLKAIQKELGEDETGTGAVVDELRQRLEKTDPPEAVMTEANRELDRLEMIPPASPEYSVITGYLDLIADLPWKVASEERIDLDKARAVLDRDHFGLQKVKRRLIEYLAVRKLNPQGRGPILCLAGPPGVGKTSLGQSIADALGRRFARLALGGIRDEAEIRGHRRTYVGAMPGRVIQEVRRAGTNNPVIMLDEVDKLGADFRGDPASALLEVLDPRQNHAFVDRYLDVPFDLSQVLFICTANYVGAVPPALVDRLEVISLPGYSDHEKLAIARRYLVPRQLKENGLKRSQCKWRVGGIRALIEYYTREAGVRELERQIGAVCRGVAARVAGAHNGKALPRGGLVINPERIRELLGPEKYVRDLDTRTENAGVAIGLAYTSVGGEVLFIEATAFPGQGRTTLTGQIGEVMKESVSAALSLFKSRAPSFEYKLSKLRETDVHIHVPAGAVPKDGPSAGVAMYAAVASLLLGVPLKPRVAMTGEITLRGKVLPVGGIKEKALAASRAGIRTVLLPEANRRDLEDIDEKVRKKLRFVFVENVDDVLRHALGERRLKAAIRAQAKEAPHQPEPAPQTRQPETPATD